MLTLDVLARMAERMPSEPAGEAGKSAYRRPDEECRIRAVTLPPVEEERRAALRLFATVVGGGVSVLTLGGLAVTYVGEVAMGAWPTLEALARTATWYGGWSTLGLASFAGLGLWRELRRYRRVRARIGPCGWLASDGTLSSEDGRRAVCIRRSLG